jgi:hypothetical protein
MIRFLQILTVTIIGFSIAGCVNSVNNPNTSGNSISITITSPKDYDTLHVGSNTVTYTAGADQGISKIDLYLDSVYVKSFSTTTSSGGFALPTITIDLDSTKVGTRHSYFLIAYDAKGNSKQSTTYYNLFVVKVYMVPAAPYNLALIHLSANIVNLSWQDSSLYVDGYRLERKDGNNAAYVEIKDLPSKTFNTDDQISDLTITYYYRICSYNQIGNSLYSNEVATGGNISAPTNLTAVAKATNRVLLTWQNNTIGENYFRIDRRQSWSDTYQAVGTVPYNTTTFLDSTSGLVANTDYFYRVVVFTGSDSATSGEVGVTTLPYNLYAPSNLTATAFNASTIRLYWTNNVSFTTTIIVERKNGASGQWLTYATLSQSQTPTTYDDNNVLIGNTYYYRVQTTDGTYFSDYSNEANATAQYVTVNPPTNLNAVYMGGSIVKLTWTRNSDNESGFVVEREDSTGGTGFIQIDQVAAGITSDIDYNTMPQHIYIYRVAATDNVFLTAYTNQAILTRP